MDFEEWLFDRYKREDDDVVTRFAKRFVVGDWARDWPVPMDSLEKLEDFIKKIDFDSEDIMRSYLFAARTAWNDYQKEIGNVS